MYKRGAIVNCVVVGDGGIGKNFLIMADGGKAADDPKLVNGDPVQATIRYRAQQYQLTLFDKVANGKQAQKNRSAVYRQADVALVCFSTHDLSTFKSVITKWFPEIRQSSSTIPIVLIGMCQTTPTGTIQRFIPCSDIPPQSQSINFDRCVQLACEIKAKAYLECDACRKKMLLNVFEEAILATFGPSKFLKPQLKLNCFR